jgi:hypothetical protein
MTSYPVFPFTEVEFDYWPRPAVGVASDADQARGLIESKRCGLPEVFDVRRLCREFCRIWAGVSVEAVARCNRLPEGTWLVRGFPDGMGIEVTGWFIVDREDGEPPGIPDSSDGVWTTC